jgi:hypothetical protein
MSPTLTIQTWRYHVPNDRKAGEGWAILFLDSIGCFTALSDWGNYGNRWQESGWGKYDFRKFVLEMGDDYLLNKITHGQDEYDADATLRSIKRDILEARRSGQQRLFHIGEFVRHGTAAWARSEWYRLEAHGDLYTEDDFNQWTQVAQLDEPWGYHCRRAPMQAQMFVKRCMPRLREMIRNEIEREQRAEARP